MHSWLLQNAVLPPYLAAGRSDTRRSIHLVKRATQCHCQLTRRGEARLCQDGLRKAGSHKSRGGCMRRHMADTCVVTKVVGQLTMQEHAPDSFPRWQPPAALLQHQELPSYGAATSPGACSARGRKENNTTFSKQVL